jgi:hypothetical protein
VAADDDHILLRFKKLLGNDLSDIACRRVDYDFHSGCPLKEIERSTSSLDPMTGHVQRFPTAL